MSSQGSSLGSFLAIGLTCVVILAHVFFMCLEMFLWTTPFAKKRFKMSAEQAQATAVLAKNMGLYNGFMAAGLVWGLILEPVQGFNVQVFFLVCIIIAGIYGSQTAMKSILYTQAVPAILALSAVWFFH